MASRWYALPPAAVLLVAPRRRTSHQASLRALKAAVPNGQRFGPGLADSTSTQDVFGVGTDGDARVGSLALDGMVQTDTDELDLVGLNQYAIAVNGIGAFTADWGTASRMRAVCGTDTDRQAPCSDQTAEVTVTDGTVSATSEQPGSGAIGVGAVVLVGREDGAKQLDQLAIGDTVTIDYRLDHHADPAYAFAVGGAPILRDGSVLSGVDSGALAPRTVWWPTPAWTATPPIWSLWTDDPVRAWG